MFCAGIKRNKVFLLSFPFGSHVKVFSWVILSVCLFRYPLSYFSSHYCFQDFFVFMLVPALPLLLQAAVMLSLLLSLFLSKLFFKRFVVCHTGLCWYIFCHTGPLLVYNLKHRSLPDYHLLHRPLLVYSLPHRHLLVYSLPHRHLLVCSL